MRIFILLIICPFLLLSCKDDSKIVLLSGDSWAFLVCSNGSMDQALIQAGIQQTSANVDCPATTKIGIRAENWFGSGFHQRTLKALEDSKVKILYMSLGGNDFLNHWKKSMNASEEREVFEKIKSDLEATIESYVAARPDVKIVLSGYDYPRFTTDHPIKEYREAYAEMESPTPGELNRAIVRYSDYVSQLANHSNIFYIHHFGLMHFYVGNHEFALPPFTTLTPDLISSKVNPNQIGGNIELQSDPDAMLRIGNIADAFHLNKFGYDKIADHVVMMYFRDWLQN